jgi:5-methylcytosine-specific restriction endonuclease McrA
MSVCLADGRGNDMAKKKENVTPKSRIKDSIRKLWLRSRERASAIKRDKYTCQKCGAKQSRRKGSEIYVEVHHLDGITNWEEVYKAIYEYILTRPDRLITLCKECHDKQEHKK